MSGQSPTGNQVSAILDDFLDWCGRHRSAGTLAWYETRCQSFWDHLKSKNLNFLDAGELRPFHLEEWLKDHPRWNPGMQRGALRAVQRAFTWAVKQGRIKNSPLAGLEKPPPGRRENVITPEIFLTIIGKVKDTAFRDLLITAWEVGCRPEEIRKVEARHHDNQRWVFPAKESKGKKKIRIVYLTPKAEEITKRRAQRFPSGPASCRNDCSRPCLSMNFYR